MIGPLTAAIAYLLGSLPFGYWIVRWRLGIDVRTAGSGGTGATNVMRNLGIAGFLATFILDFGKGLAAILITSRLTHADPRWIAVAAIAAVAGHIFPVWLKFHGGKGVSTAIGVFFALAPIPLLLSLIVFAVLAGISRYVSLGSIFGVASFPVWFGLLGHPPSALLGGAVAVAALIIVRHRTNIGRLLAGTESKLGKNQPAVRSY